MQMVFCAFSVFVFVVWVGCWFGRERGSIGEARVAQSSVWVITLSLMTGPILPDVWAVVWEVTQKLPRLPSLVQTQVSDCRAWVFSSASGYRGSKTRSQL